MAGAQTPAGRDSGAWVFRLALIVAMVVHLPLTPLPFILRWLSGYLHRNDTSWDYQDDSVIIPISLVDDTSTPPPPPKSEPAVAPGGAGDEATRRAHPSPRDAPKDAGADVEIGDAGRDAPLDRPRGRDSGVDRREPRDASDGGGDAPSTTANVKDTLSLVGGLKHVVKGKPNVALVFWFSTMREHSLGPLVASILACNPQWKDFLGDIIDPLQDLDGVMLVGPRFADTSKVTVLAQSRMDDAKMREVMGLVANNAEKSGRGGFVDAGAGTQAVRFHADRADRIAFTHPKNLVIVTPPDGFEQLMAQREPMSLPPARGQAMSLTMVNPWRPLRAVGMHLPETLSEIRVNVYAVDGGGVSVEIEFDDQDAEAANAHAADLTSQARGAAGPLLSDITFEASGNRLRAETRLSRFTSAVALGFVRGSICPPAVIDAGHTSR